MNFWLSQLTLVGVYIVLVCSYDLIAGRAGLLSLAHAALFGVGAYTTSLVMIHTGFTDIIGLVPIAAIAAGLLSLPIAALSLRVRKEYFAVTSMGFAFAFIAVLQNVPFFGQSEGLIGIPTMTLGPLTFSSVIEVTVLALCIAAVVVVATVWLVRSRWGLNLAAVRDSENGAVSFGINPVAMRTAAVVISGAGAGIAGALYVVYAKFVSPDTFDLPTLALVVAMLGFGQTLGSIGYVAGPVVLVGVSAGLQYLHVVSLTVLGPVDQIIYGLVMVFAIMAVPREFRVPSRRSSPPLAAEVGLPNRRQV
jgi:branched-chain amino acid transport system permease protein